MTIEVKVPALPESVADAVIAAWHKKVGESVKRDENLVDLETDKVVLEVPSPVDGILEEVLFNVGDTVKSGELLAKVVEGAIPLEKSQEDNISDKEEKNFSNKENLTSVQEKETQFSKQKENVAPISPSVRRILSEKEINAQEISGSGKEGRITKEDINAFLTTKQEITEDKGEKDWSNSSRVREERRVPMSRLRTKIAERLVSAQHNAAMLTTFNEVNLKAIVDLRIKYKDEFEKKHGIKLGFMSFFTKAVTEALKLFPSVNASIDDNDIVYHGYYDIGIAVSTERGLVVPVIRDASELSLVEIEKNIMEFAAKARQGKLALQDMQGGTFTITNGGIFGSLLATPIINPPQTGILGMHKIEDRPIVENGEIVIRPMMYLALSYDHRLIDGKESVQFLVTVKDLLQDPLRLLLNI